MEFRFPTKNNYLMENFPSYEVESVLKPKYIIIHDTAGMSSAKDESVRLYNNSTQYNNGIAHYYVDEKEGYQLVLDNVKAYHAGDGVYGRGNGESLSIEVCRSLASGGFSSNSEKERYEKALDNAYKIAADLCEQYDINPSNILQHNECSSTACPYTQKVLYGSYEKAKSQAKTKIKEYLKGDGTMYYVNYRVYKYPLLTPVGDDMKLVIGQDYPVRRTNIYRDFEMTEVSGSILDPNATTEDDDGGIGVLQILGYNKRGYQMHKVVTKNGIYYVPHKKKEEL